MPETKGHIAGQVSQFAELKDLRVKISGPGEWDETTWKSITPDQLKRIVAILDED